MNGEPHYTHYDKETKLKRNHTHTFTLISIFYPSPLLPVIVFSISLQQKTIPQSNHKTTNA